MTKTYSTKASDIKREWHIIDASDKVLGKLATQIAGLLMGKYKSIFCRHLDTGDFVVVVNADKVVFTGNKWNAKFYYRHSGYLGGLKKTSAKELIEKKPEEVLRFAVRRMHTKNSLGRKQLKKLKIYAGPDHPHMAQQPEKWEI